MGYVIFEDDGINRRIYHAFYISYKYATKELRKFKGNAFIGFMCVDEFKLMIEE